MQRQCVGAVIAAVLCALVPIASNAADWTRFRGPEGRGVAAEAKLPTAWSPSQNVAWKTSQAGAGTSSPVVLNGRLYVTGYSGYAVPSQPVGTMSDLARHVVALDANSGQVLWKRAIPTKLPEQENIRDGHGYASSTPATDGERLYVFFGKSGVFALDLAGKILWHADVGSGLNGWGSAASPVLYKDLVIVNASVESGSLVALDKRTGREAWRTGGIKESWNTPILVENPAGRAELVLAIMGKVLGFDPERGRQLWTADTDIGWYMVPSLVAGDGVVYCVGGRNGGGALAVKTGGSGDVTTSHRLWANRKGTNVPSPLIHDGHLYWAHENLGIVYCAEASTGNLVYEQRLARGDQFYASPVLADGKIYYLARNGRMFVVAARPEFELVATIEPLERGTFNASSVVDGNRLLIRSDRTLWCLSQ